MWQRSEMKKIQEIDAEELKDSRRDIKNNRRQ